jgi:adenylate cyclase
MVTDDFRRKLAAVLCADVAGYTKMMAGAESATHASFLACLNEIVLPALETFRGRIVKSTGDGFIAVFDSVVDSLACALAIQEGVAGRKGGARLTFRIGVNVGDVITEEWDVFGDGVNVAARLQALAAPGGVCVSALLRDQVRGKLQVEFESLGRKRVKKGEAPLHAYAVRAIPAHQSRGLIGRSVARMRPVVRRMRVTGIAAAAIFTAALVTWQTDPESVHRLARRLAGDEAPHLALPDRPSLVVLPFKTIGAGHEQEYFADGITEDVITDLARVHGMFVIARTSSFAYKSRLQDVRKIGRDLGVRYALVGSVRRSDNTVRIDAQLVDALNGGHIWAARFDRPLGDIFKIQDEITRKIVNALSVSLTEREQVQPPGAHTTSMAAYDAFLRGWAAYRLNTFEEYQTATEYFETAITLDPTFAQAHAALAAAYLATRMYSWTRVESFRSPVQIVLDAGRHDRELLEKARQQLALAMRSPTSLAYRSSAEILIFESKYDEAIEQVRKAVALGPNDADNYAVLGSVLVWAGQPEAAIEPIEQAMRLNPRHPPLYFCYYGSALFSLGRYKEAGDKFERCQTGNPDNLWSYIYLIAIYAYQGQDAKAATQRERATDLLRRQDRSLFSVKEVRNRTRYRYQADLLRLLVGLHKGHVPDSLF